jgi:polysaccharide pyruvyl transferase WcaK-like protein
VGANAITRPVTRWLFDSAARLAFYRSYRDNGSREAMRQRGVDVTGDQVYPDLAFSLPVPPYDPGSAKIVGVGVMDYHGGNDDRKQARELYTAYVDTMKSFVRWLLDDGRQVRILLGDTNNSDEAVVREILADVREYQPDAIGSRIVAEPVTSFAELMSQMAPAGLVVATRFHNVICALHLGKPTISLGYAPKFTALMGDMGLGDYCQSAKSLSVDQLIKQFMQLEKRQEQLREMIAERNAAYEKLLEEQFVRLSALLFPVITGRGK